MHLLRQAHKISTLKYRTMQMVRDFIFETVYPHWNMETIAEDMGTTEARLRRLVESEKPSFSDLLVLLSLTEIDFGITIRFGNGREVTFFAGDNFGTKEGVEQVLEEDVQYPEVFEADGNFDIEASSLDEELISFCENCMANERVIGSILCEFCITTGVEASLPEQLEPATQITAHISQKTTNPSQGLGDSTDEPTGNLVKESGQ